MPAPTTTRSSLSPRSGCATSSQPAISRRERLMSAQLSMFDLLTSPATPSAISSPVSADGRLPCVLPAGPMAAPSGQAPAPASPILPPPMNGSVGSMIPATSGRSGSVSSSPSALTQSLASRLTTALPGSTERLLIWSRRALPSGRSIFRLVPSMRPTSACEPSLWPTPTVQDAENKAGPSQWVRNTWALNVQVVAHSLGVTSRPESLDAVGGLAPGFACWLMGYPAEWDACAPTAMPSSRKSRRSSSAPISTHEDADVPA